MNLWTEQDDPIERVFDDADRAARPTRVQRTYRRKPCNLHSEPGPEFYRDQDSAEVPVTDELRERWDREAGDVLVIRRTIVGTCTTAGCAPTPEPEPAPVRTDPQVEEPPEPKTETKSAVPVFWVL